MRSLVLGFLVLSLLVAGPVQSEAAIVINEVLADPAADADGDGAVSATKDEFVELANTDAVFVSLANWTLSDAVTVRHTFGADASIAGYGFLTVFGGLALNNTGDAVTLKDASQAVIDSVVFGPEGGKDVSLTRSPDGSGLFIAHPEVAGLFFSPGKTIDGIAHLPIPDSGSLPLPDPEPLPLPDPDPVPFPDPQDTSGIPVVPEPGTWMLFGFGLSAAVNRANRRRII